MTTDINARHLPFRVDEWDHEGNRLVQVIAASSNQIVAKAAFDAAKVLFPNCRPTLRHGARVIAAWPETQKSPQPERPTT